MSRKKAVRTAHYNELLRFGRKIWLAKNSLYYIFRLFAESQHQFRLKMKKNVDLKMRRQQVGGFQGLILTSSVAYVCIHTGVKKMADCRPSFIVT
jgi:hypothetical protein